MVNLCQELNVRLLEWIIGWKADAEPENAAGVGTIRRRHDDALPIEDVIVDGAGAAASGRVLLNVGELFLNATLGHLLE
jgi:hypothetical protein